MTSSKNSSWDTVTESHNAMAEEALKKGYKKEFLVKTGLCYETDDHQLRDRFGDA